jgi:hypothetical protein
LQKAVEKLTGSKLEELAQEFVFKPLPIEGKIGPEKFSIFLEALKTSNLMKLQPFLTDILDITSEKDTRARLAANSLHTTAGYPLNLTHLSNLN